MQRRRTFGGGVSPRGTLLRGQSIIEYVLIAAVIGLVIVFAGPGVAGAIRNQFNQVTNTVDSGTDGDSFISAEEKAYREAMKTVAQKEAKDWTIDEQKAAATDIAKNGTSSVVYAKAKAAMDAGTTWSVKLTNGERMEYRIIGINHDDLADSSGKAGLTFWAINDAVGAARMNATNSNVGGWERSELRSKMNSGEIWNLMPNNFQSKVKSVTKLTNNEGGSPVNKNAAVTATADKLFLLSSNEVLFSPRGASDFPWLSKEGIRYESFSCSSWGSFGQGIWLRSIWPYENKYRAEDNMFQYPHPNYSPENQNAINQGEHPQNLCSVRPAFCF